MLLAVISFLKHVLEAWLHMHLIIGAGSYQSANYYVEARPCQAVLLLVALAGTVLFATEIEILRERKSK